MNKMFGTNIRINFVPGAGHGAHRQPARDRIYRRAEVARRHPARRGAADLPVVKVNFFEQVDWKKYLPGRITDEMIELDGKIIRIVTGLSGATYNSALAPMKPTTLEDFLKPEWKGKIASTPYSAGFDVLLADDVWGKDEDRQLRPRAVEADHRPHPLRRGRAHRHRRIPRAGDGLHRAGRAAVEGEGRAARADDAARCRAAALLLLRGAEERPASRRRPSSTPSS